MKWYGLMAKKLHNHPSLSLLEKNRSSENPVWEKMDNFLLPGVGGGWG